MEGKTSTQTIANKPDWQTLRDSLCDLPQPVARPVLEVISDLPGTGKSFLSRQLAQQFPLVVLKSYALRKALFPQPGYSGKENARFYNANHPLIGYLLGQKIPVLLDATNLLETRRRRLYQVADQNDAKLVVVQVDAPKAMVQRRLESRSQDLHREDHSDAAWSVYKRMRSSAKK